MLNRIGKDGAMAIGMAISLLFSIGTLIVLIPAFWAEHLTQVELQDRVAVLEETAGVPPQNGGDPPKMVPGTPAAPPSALPPTSTNATSSEKQPEINLPKLPAELVEPAQAAEETPPPVDPGPLDGDVNPTGDSFDRQMSEFCQDAPVKRANGTFELKNCRNGGSTYYESVVICTSWDKTPPYVHGCTFEKR